MKKTPKIETTKNAFRASETFLFKRYGHFEFLSFSVVNIALILKIFFKFLSFLRVFSFFPSTFLDIFPPRRPNWKKRRKIP